MSALENPPTTEPSTSTSDAFSVRFDVQDTGIGIHEETLPRLFRAFSQADGSTTRKYGGTGLGLAISKQLVELMKGEIAVTSRPGLGSTFTFSLPFIPASHLKPYPTEYNRELSGLKLLIVEDNHTNREILTEYAQSWGMSVNAVPSALAALDLLRKSAEEEPPYDLIIIDMKMMGMNGLELGHRIKADSVIAHIPLVMLTSTMFLGEASRANVTGFSAYLIKPIHKHDLYNALLSALQPGSDLAKTEALKTPCALSTKLLNTRILLAEDNPVNQEVAQHMLQGFGCTVDLVDNGVEALTAIGQTNYDLVFMDCMMPEMDGYQATAEIRRWQNSGQIAHFPIIALTANAIEGDREKCLIAGMDDYLSKPFKTESLLRVIKTWVKTASEIAVENPKQERLAEPNQHTASILNIDTLEAIRNLDRTSDNEFLQSIIALYLRNASELLTSLETAWSDGNIDKIRTVSHTLRSSSNQVGAFNLPNSANTWKMKPGISVLMFQVKHLYA